MAYYNYKRVVYREDFEAEVKAYDAAAEAEGYEKYEGTVDYDGDAWFIAERLLDRKDAALRGLMVAYERLIRSQCPTAEEWLNEHKPWRVAEYVAAENALPPSPSPTGPGGES